MSKDKGTKNIKKHLRINQKPKWFLIIKQKVKAVDPVV